MRWPRLKRRSRPSKPRRLNQKAFTLNFVSLSDCIEDAKILDNAYVVKGMIGQGEVVGLAAKFNTGKTFFALHLAACVATGMPFLRTSRHSRGRHLRLWRGKPQYLTPRRSRSA